MSTTYISVELRRLVAERAEHLCEYCMIAAGDTFFGCQVDHIISEKHGGPTETENLAYACLCCNQAKGCDVGSIDWESGEFVRFFNPRIDRWADHFALFGLRIDGLTKIGHVTERILGFNSDDRILERETLKNYNRYPPPKAVEHIKPVNGRPS